MSQQTDSSKLTNVLLNGRNYLSWVRAVTLALSSRGKLEFITGENQKPKPKDPQKPDETEKKAMKDWQTQDHQVMVWLLGAIEPQISDIFSYADNAESLWGMVREIYGQEQNFSHIYQLKQEVAQIKQKGRLNSEYV